MFGAIVATCIFTLKMFGLIDVTWWLVAPMAIVASITLTFGYSGRR